MTQNLSPRLKENGDKPFDKSPKICNFVSATIKIQVLPSDDSQNLQIQSQNLQILMVKASLG